MSDSAAAPPNLRREVVTTPAQAVAQVGDGMTVAVGGLPMS